MRKRQIYVTPTPALDFLLKEMSEQEQVSISSIARRALIDHFGPELAEIKARIKAGEIELTPNRNGKPK